MSKYSKIAYVKIFNKLFQSMLIKVKSEFDGNIDIKAGIDLINSKCGYSECRTVINIFNDMLLPQEEICNYIMNKNEKKLRDLDFKNINTDSMFLKICDLFKNTNNKQKLYDEILSTATKLIKITRLYNDADD